MKEVYLVFKLFGDDRWVDIGYIAGNEEDVIRYCEEHSGEYCYMVLTNLLSE